MSARPSGGAMEEQKLAQVGHLTGIDNGATLAVNYTYALTEPDLGIWL